MTEQDDPVIDGYLHSLHRLAPRPGFADRVLSRVWRPAPMFILVWQDRMRRALSPRRAWTAAGAMAAGSAAWIVAIGSWLSSGAAALASEAVVSSWNTALTTATSLTSVAALHAAPVAPYGGPALGVVTVSAAGLYYLWRRTARERARSYAAR